MIVRIARNYDYPDIARQSPANSMIWNGITFTEEPVQECDYLVVFNYPKEDFTVKVGQGGTLLLIQEPPYKKLSRLTNLFPYFDHVYSGFNVKHKGHLNLPAALPWHVGRSYDELTKLKLEEVEKSQNVSCVTSNSNMNPGHQPRLDFLDFLRNENFDFALMGRGFQPIEDKYDGLAPYKYTIAIENYSAEDYWTEKIVDCFLTFTMPIYHGCPNIADYFPKEAMVQIDINDPPAAVAKIKEAVEGNFWEKNIEAIKEARRKVLEEFQFFPFMESFIKAHPVSGRKKTVSIPHFVSENKPSLIKRIIRKF